MKKRKHSTASIFMISQVFKRIVFSINILMVVLLIASNLAGVVSPDTLAIFVLFGLASPYFLIANLLFALFWGVLRHRYFLLSTVALLISIPLINDTFRFIPKIQGTEVPGQFKALSYNVRVFDLYNWSHNKITRDKIFQLIRRENPDIACFQEYFNSTKADFPVHDSLIRNQQFRYSHLFMNVSLKNGNQFGIATYSTFPIIHKEVILFEGTHNLAILSDIKIAGDTLRVLNCHLESVRFLARDYEFMDSIAVLSEKQRLLGFNGLSNRLLKASKKRAQQTQILFEAIEKSPYPLLLCGDFNDTPASYTYQHISGLLHDSFSNHSLGMGGTYSRFFPPLRIDYIMYQDPIRCHDFKTLKADYSDHYPIVGNYSLH